MLVYDKSRDLVCVCTLFGNFIYRQANYTLASATCIAMYTIHAQRATGFRFQHYFIDETTGFEVCPQSNFLVTTSCVLLSFNGVTE